MRQPKDERIQSLEKEIRNLETEFKENEEICQQMAARRKVIDSTLRDRRAQLSHLTPKQFIVTDHALLRYLERHYNIDMDAHRREILAQVDSFKELGTVKAKGFVIKNNAVITYLAQEGEAN